jgi:hypothetical protein
LKHSRQEACADSVTFFGADGGKSDTSATPELCGRLSQTSSSMVASEDEPQSSASVNEHGLESKVCSVDFSDSN